MSQSLFGMLQKLGSDMGLGRLELNQLLEAHQKNLDAVAKLMEGAQPIASKQNEILQTVLRETATMVRDFKPTGSPQEIAAKQAEFAKKAFDLTIQNTRAVAELATKSTTDAVTILQDRLREGLRDLRN